MKKLILLGGGGHCRSCIDVIEQEGIYEIAGILDKKELLGEKILAYDFVGTDDDISKFVSMGCEFLVTVGQIKSSLLRENIFSLLKVNNAQIATVVSPRAYVSKHANIGMGTIVMHDALINVNATIGNNCIINSKALIEHDSDIGNNCHISTGAIINGSVCVDDNSFVGSNAVSREGCYIKKNTFIKAGGLAK